MMLMAVLKFIVDSTAMGFASHNHMRYLKFTSAYLQFMSSSLKDLSADKSQFKEEKSKEFFTCVKNSYTYATKLLNAVLNASDETSPAPVKSFNLANDLIDLIISVELFLGSIYAARLVAVAKPWLLDLVLALSSTSMLEKSLERAYATVLNHIKCQFPTWPSILANIELAEMRESDSGEEDGRVSHLEFPVFKKLMAMIISLLKGNRSILDAVGVVILASSVVALERKDFGLLLGLVRFICVTMIQQEDREWSGLDMMLVSLPDIFPRLEREMEEHDEDESHKLHNTRALLESVWLYHVYETKRFSEVEE